MDYYDFGLRPEHYPAVPSGLWFEPHERGLVESMIHASLNRESLGCLPLKRGTNFEMMIDSMD
jgi:hypothetical protein